jgi:hypothetical protein
MCVAVLICCKSDTTTTSPLDYSGTWSGVQPGTDTTLGRGVIFTVDSRTVTSVSFSTENRFGTGVGALPPGCHLAFEAVGPATISGDNFTVELKLSNTPVPDVSSLCVASAASFSVAPMLTCQLSGSSCTGQVNFSIDSAQCCNHTYAGVGPGFGTNTRTWTATKK